MESRIIENGLERIAEKEVRIKKLLVREQKQGGFGLYTDDVDAIAHISEGQWDLIGNSFDYGFIKGYRKAKADMKKKAQIIK